jgi:hypothetical protein
MHYLEGFRDTVGSYGHRAIVFRGSLAEAVRPVLIRATRCRGSCWQPFTTLEGSRPYYPEVLHGLNSGPTAPIARASHRWLSIIACLGRLVKN